jgi:hypothetical protein
LYLEITTYNERGLVDKSIGQMARSQTKAVFSPRKYAHGTVGPLVPYSILSAHFIGEMRERMRPTICGRVVNGFTIQVWSEGLDGLIHSL